MERYVVRDGKKLRYGFTTGSCAAAAAKGAVLELFHNETVDYMTIDTPKGWSLDIELEHIQFDHRSATCAVVKDAGDDPDVTDGIRIYATAMVADEPGIHVEGGIGIGRVTKKGLRVPVGEPAINPVPLSMIREEVGKVLPEGKGVDIIIYAPEGVEIAKKTFNPKLGIIGGISILGTSGIVEPMSEDAFKASLQVELSVLRATGKEDVIFVFGNFGRDHLLEEFNGRMNDNSLEKVVQKTSNFVAYMINAAKELGFKRILYVGHIGKMVKVAAGMGNTHSKYGDNRMASIVACAQGNGDPLLTEEQEQQILEANTTDEAIEILQSIGVAKEVQDRIVRRCKEVCEMMADHQVTVETYMFSTIYGQLGQTEGAMPLLKSLLSHDC